MAGSVACCLSQAAYYIAHIQPNSWSLKVIRWKKNANQPKRRLESVANQCWRRETRRYLDMLVDAAGYHNTNRSGPVRLLHHDFAAQHGHGSWKERFCSPRLISQLLRCAKVCVRWKMQLAIQGYVQSKTRWEDTGWQASSSDDADQI